MSFITDPLIWITNPRQKERMADVLQYMLQHLFILTLNHEMMMMIWKEKDKKKVKSIDVTRTHSYATVDRFHGVTAWSRHYRRWLLHLTTSPFPSSWIAGDCASGWRGLARLSRWNPLVVFYIIWNCSPVCNECSAGLDGGCPGELPQAIGTYSTWPNQKPMTCQGFAVLVHAFLEGSNRLLEWDRTRRANDKRTRWWKGVVAERTPTLAGNR